MDFLYRGGDLGPALAGQVVADLLLGLAEPGARAALSGCRTAEGPPAPPTE